jgi:hypothetical protein
MTSGLKNRLLAIGIGWISTMCAITPNAIAQNSDKNPIRADFNLHLPVGMEIGFGIGYVLPHRNLMQHLVTDHSKRISMAYGRQLVGGWTEGRQLKGTHWQGVELAWTYLGGEQMGSVASALWLTRFPRSKWGRGELGIGAGWSSLPWDAIKAPSSVATSTHLNAGLHAAWCIRLFQAERSVWTIKARITHFSNGAISLPNLGVNNMGIDVQHQWRDNHQIPQQRLTDYSQYNRVPFSLEMSARAGVRDVGLPGGALHPIFNLHILGYHKAKRSKSAGWALANDIGYNQSLRVTSESSGGINPMDRLQYSVLGGIRWNFHRIQLTALQGWMCTNPDLELGRSHLTVTMHFEMNSAVAVELGLKSFQFRADYPYLGIRHQFGQIRTR